MLGRHFTVWLVRADNTAWTPLRPAHGVKTFGDSPIVIRGTARFIVNGQSLKWLQRVAYGGNDESTFNFKEFTGTPRPSINDLGFFHPDTGHLVVTENFNGLSVKGEMHSFGLGVGY